MSLDDQKYKGFNVLVLAVMKMAILIAEATSALPEMLGLTLQCGHQAASLTHYPKRRYRSQQAFGCYSSLATRSIACEKS